MFITKEELQTAIYEYQLADITGMDVDDIAVWHAVAAAVSEASSYLNAKYDIRAIFSAEGDDRHPLLVEHVKSIAVWYIIKRANTDIIFDRAKEYYKAAIDWLKLVAGVGTDDETIAPDLLCGVPKERKAEVSPPPSVSAVTRSLTTGSTICPLITV